MPVATIIEFEKIEEAVKIANDTSYGLGSTIFTQDIELTQDLAINHLQAGACCINDFVKSDPWLPFVGIKNSGYGREFANFGIKEFSNINQFV